MRVSRVLLTLAAFAASLALAVVPARSRKASPPCPPARYLLAPALIDSSASGEAIAASEAAIAIDGVCEPIAPRKFKGTRKGTRVKARWPTCTGLDGRVKLSATIRDDCQTFRGRLKARRFKQKLEGMLSRCGDGTVDAGAGEQCDPPQPGACDSQCREAATATIGPAGGQITSPDGRLTLAVPAGALASDTPVTIRRLLPDEVPQSAADLGAGAGYDLAPDGLQFLVPVTATLVLEVSPLQPDGSVVGDLAQLFTVGADGGAPEFLAEQETVLDGVDDISTASGQLAHFSNVFEQRIPSVARLRASVPPEVQGQFAIAITLTLDFPGATNPVVHTHEVAAGAIAYTKETVRTIGEVGSSSPNPFVGQVDGYECQALGVGRYEGQIRALGTRATGGGFNPAAVNFRPKLTTTCMGAVTTTTVSTSTTQPGATTTTEPGATTTTTITTSTTTTTTTTALPTTTTSSTTTTTTSTTTTTTIPCALDTETVPPECGGDCPPVQVCRFQNGTCQCVPTLDICRDLDQGPGAVCGGVCPSPDDRCGQIEPDAPCTCIFCTRDPGGSCIGTCPIGQGTCADVGGTCTCVVEGTTTTTVAVTTTTTTTSTTTTSTVPLGIGGRGLELDFDTGPFPAGNVLCLHDVFGGCVAFPDLCPDDHTHLAIAVRGTSGSFPDQNPMECGQGAVLANVPGCQPDVMPFCGASIPFVANLTAADVVPPSGSGESGSCSGSMASNQSALSLTCSHGVANPTEAHVHFGPAGMNGPIVATLAVHPTSAFGTVPMTPERVAGLFGEELYVDIHSSGFPDGSVRGPLNATWMIHLPLDGTQEVPPSGSTARGACDLVVNAQRTSLNVSCTHDVANPTVAHVHQAPPGMIGGIVIDLGSGASPISTTAPLTPPLVDALAAGNLYLNVHSSAFIDGEIRGQITLPDPPYVGGP